MIGASVTAKGERIAVRGAALPRSGDAGVASAAVRLDGGERCFSSARTPLEQWSGADGKRDGAPRRARQERWQRPCDTPVGCRRRRGAGALRGWDLRFGHILGRTRFRYRSF